MNSITDNMILFTTCHNFLASHENNNVNEISYNQYETYFYNLYDLSFLFTSYDFNVDCNLEDITRKGG